MIGPTLVRDLDASAIPRPAGVRDVHVLAVRAGRPLEFVPIPDVPASIDAALLWRCLSEAAIRAAMTAAPSGPQGDPSAITVCVCTRDRPDVLGACLDRLRGLDPAPAEILVVDSASRDPAVASTLAAAVGVRVLRADRPGLSIARNLALQEVRSPWLAFTDDDALVPEGWVGAVAAAVADSGAQCVTGPVVPAAIPSRAAELFEEYGGLGRGFDDFDADASFLCGWSSPPTWLLGAGASMAVDVAVARALGGFDPMLGAGMRAGCSEDTDLFLRLLRAGHRLRYAARAWVMHNHRADLPALRRQLAAYGRGHTAAQWKAFVTTGDIRPLGRIVLGLPLVHARRIVRTMIGRSGFPIGLILAEALGNLVGPFVWRRIEGAAVR